MVDYQRIVDEIRSFLQSTDQTLTDQVKEWAGAYAEACKEANARLRRCEEFLQKGLRSEAIHLAQAEPVLLDLLGTLDFPERSQWDEVLFTYNLPSAPKLNIASAEALNEAYTAVLPLEQLLRKHRLLALVRAPLPERLAVMRQIAQIDTSNPVWSEDIGEFEKARIRQMEAEVEGALRENNTGAIQALVGEIRTTQWATSPPLQLIQRVEDLARQKENKRFRESLHALENELHDAVSACDAERVKRLRDRWNAEALRGNLSLKDPLWDRVTPAFDWLAKQERRLAEERKHQAAVREFENALKENAALADLKAAYRDVSAFAAGVPAELEEIYLARRERMRRAAARIKQRVLIGAAAAGVVLACGIGYWIYQENRSRKVAEAVQTLRKMLESDDTAGAVNYLAKLESGVAQAPDVESLRKQVEKRDGEERLRADEFQAAFQDLEKAPYDNDREQTAKAKRLAKLTKEKSDLHQLVRKREGLAGEWRQQRDRDFKARADALDGRIRKLGELLAQNPELPTALSDLGKLQAEEAALVKESAGDEARRVLDKVRSGLRNIQKDMELYGQEKDFLGKMARVVQMEEGEKYVQTLVSYRKQFSGTARAKDFELVLQEKETWQPVIEWNQLIYKWKNAPFRISFEDAKKQGEKVSDFRRRHPKFVGARVAQDYQLSLEAITQQDERLTKSAASELRQVFLEPLVRDLWVLEDKGKVYYLRQNPRILVERARERADDRFKIEYLAGFDAMNQIKTDNAFIITRPEIKIGRAPQSVVADKVKGMGKSFAEGQWERATMTIAQLIVDEKEIDPIEQLFLLKEVLSRAAKGSYPLALALKDHLKVIEDGKVDLNVPWFNPDSDSASRVRSFAKKAVTDMPSLNGVVAAAAAKRGEIETALAQSYREAVGWLAWDQENKRWQCRSDEKLAGNQTLWVVREKGGAAWEAIGKVVDGKVILEPEKEHRQGRVVFASR
jgi:hypothetical protein